ncbi:hypothetical protein AUJ77_03675 [Candidatus Nomurabacteria bacterium CG1_02_43_90]|uniref:Uncharacterized protein n=1 Tax=Candidatus Nomurabacteria bacterium CG1_02_43_90 TaxID=1805281 RepID=A0A1J4V2L6_9BACT|nr:MAG: hypothetical protein AUJ77_03675 [Candidatus Nomurabacteria bacterium CG1_02_43_90]
MGKALVVGFSHQTGSRLEGSLRGYRVERVRSFTDALHKMGEKEFDLIVVNADCFSNDQISTVYRMQYGKCSQIVVIHGEKSRRKPLVAEGLAFVSMSGAAQHFVSLAG